MTLQKIGFVVCVSIVCTVCNVFPKTFHKDVDFENVQVVLHYENMNDM